MATLRLPSNLSPLQSLALYLRHAQVSVEDVTMHRISCGGFIRGGLVCEDVEFGVRIALRCCHLRPIFLPVFVRVLCGSDGK